MNKKTFIGFIALAAMLFTATAIRAEEAATSF